MKYYFKCPSCGSDAEFLIPNEESQGLGLLLFLYGGLIPTLLYADTTCRRVQCAKCGYLFRQPTLPRTVVSRLAAWIIGIIFLFGLFTLFMIAFPEIPGLLPQSPILMEIEQVISDNPRAIFLGFFPMVVLILVLSVLVSWISNHSARAELRKTHETKPKQRLETKQETAALD